MITKRTLDNLQFEDGNLLRVLKINDDLAIRVVLHSFVDLSFMNGEFDVLLNMPKEVPLPIESDKALRLLVKALTYDREKVQS